MSTMKITEKQQAFVEAVKADCRKWYAAGGDVIVEAWSDREIVAEFSSIAGVREYCAARVEDATNYREGLDDDPELVAYDKCQEWLASPLPVF